MSDHAAAPEPTRPDSYRPPQNAPAEPDPYVPSSPYAPVPPNPYAAGAPGPYTSPAVPEAAERVGRGLALALLAIPVAMILTAVIWRLGFIASISAFVLSALAVVLYRRGSGGLVKRGIPGLIGIIVVGSVACFFSAVATDLVQYYAKQSPTDQADLGTRGQFVSSNLFYGPVLSSYGKDAILFLLFAGLGIFGTLRRLLQRSRAA